MIASTSMISIKANALHYTVYHYKITLIIKQADAVKTHVTYDLDQAVCGAACIADALHSRE